MRPPYDEHCPHCGSCASHEISIHHLDNCSYESRFQTAPAILALLSKHVPRRKAINKIESRNQTLLYGVEAVILGQHAYKIGETRNLNKRMRRYPAAPTWVVPASSARIFRFWHHRWGTAGAHSIETLVHYLCRGHAVRNENRSEWFHISPWMTRLFKAIRKQFPPEQMITEVRTHAPWLIDGGCERHT